MRGPARALAKSPLSPLFGTEESKVNVQNHSRGLEDVYRGEEELVTI